MIIGLIVFEAVGIFLIAAGSVLWKKQKVSLLHDYHYQNVREEDLPEYTRQIGTGLLVMGIGLCLTGILFVFLVLFWWLPMAAGLITGIILLILAQKKFNGSVIS
jgi:cobalamin synthase